MRVLLIQPVPDAAHRLTELMVSQGCAVDTAKTTADRREHAPSQIVSAKEGLRRPRTGFGKSMRRRRPSVRTAALFLVAAIVAETVGCAPRPSPDALLPKTQVVVLAGDHLVVDGKDIVLADVETPQPEPRARCRAEIIAAEESKAAAEALVGNARYVETEFKTPKPLGLVHLDGLDLGLTLSSQGLAVPRKSVAMDWCG